MKPTALHELASWGSALKLAYVPRRVREQAIHQILSTLAAVYCGYDSDLGAPIERAFAPHGGSPASPSHSAMVMASWSMVLDYDDVMLGGHTGHSSVLVPLVMASGHSGSELLLAQIVANEIAARINMVCALGSTRGQMATHLHLIAAAAARAKLERLDASAFAAALGFALSYPSQALYPAFLGSDAKALCAGWPVRAGMESVDAVRAGLRASGDVLDCERGFFAERTRVPMREFLGGLGERWHTATNSFKIYPVCGYLCGAIDATLDLVRQHDLAAADIASVDVWSSLFAVGMDAHSAPWLDGPRSCISTLTFSTPFAIASSILARDFTPEQLKRAWIEDSRVWELAARVRTHHDVRLTLEVLRADIPIGAALRRASRLQAAVFGWTAAKTAFGKSGRLRRPLQTARLIAGLAAAGGDRRPLDFSRSTKPLGARVVIRLSDGRTFTRATSIPRGFAGGGDDVRELMRTKFIRAAAPRIGYQRAAQSVAMIENIEHLPPSSVARMFDLACQPLPVHCAR